MPKTLVYDLPTRLFHWLFAGLFITTYCIATFIDDESSLYPYHMMMGMVMIAALIMRMFWGVLGSKYARFSSFILSPTALLHYIKSLTSPHSTRSIGRNPASSWAAIAMMCMITGLGITGYLMTQNIDKHFYKEIHELLANLFLAIVGAHILGVIIHMHKHHDGLALSMIHGRKPSITGQQGITHAYRLVGVGFLVAIGCFILYIGNHYNTTQQSLHLFGTTLQLGENERNESHGAAEASESSEHETSATEHDDD
jgi:cytochrome b